MSIERPSWRRKARPRRDFPARAGWALCPCGKRGYNTRNDARLARKQNQRLAGDHVHAYRCPDSGLWHLGHVPPEVNRGELDLDEYVARITNRPPEQP